MDKGFHSVKLASEKCVGCTDCMKRCPTEAIRVRNNKAKIINELCVDCGLCIEVCKRHAKSAATDTIKAMSKYEYTIAIVDSAIFGQFKDILDANRILTGVKKLGFDDVIEASPFSSLMAKSINDYLDKAKIKGPIISSFCPTITRLITIKFPSLIENIVPVITPMEAAALAATSIIGEKGIERDKVGIFYISPCAAEVTNARYPIDVYKSQIDEVISLADIYIKLKILIKGIAPINIENLSQKDVLGIGCASVGGLASLINKENVIAVDGIDNNIKILEYVENGQLDDIDFIECNGCVGGCLGGALTSKNNFVAKNILNRVMENTRLYSNDQCRDLSYIINSLDMKRTKPLNARKIMNLDDDVSVAIEKLSEITKIYKTLPKIDCGSCGAPTCMAFAEDLVQGKATMNQCVFMKEGRA